MGKKSSLLAMPLIEINQLSFAYDRELVIEKISLEVNPYDFLAIIGPNGGGKSTLLRLMLGVLRPLEGEIKIFGKRATKGRKEIGYVPQNTNINIDFPIKVLEVVMMGHPRRGKQRFGYTQEERAEALEALQKVGMHAKANHRISSLSGGQRQRVMIARALCGKPSILILDEPTSNIDIQGQKEVYELLKKLNQSMTIIVVSHDISIILEYANKVAHLNKHLSFHDISKKKERFPNEPIDGHFCEIELLEMLAGQRSS
jgi:zinc transport system ATP-binding protein